jgi:hypothetical protein
LYEATVNGENRAALRLQHELCLELSSRLLAFSLRLLAFSLLLLAFSLRLLAFSLRCLLLVCVFFV